MSISLHIMRRVFFIGIALFAQQLHATDPASPVSFDFALYYAPTPSSNPDAKLSELLVAKYHDAFTTDSENALACSVSAKWVSIDQYAPPSRDSFHYFAKGLSEETGAAIASSKRVFVLSFRCPRSGINRANKNAGTLVADLADATAGIPWDDECRLIYSAAEWRKIRVSTWEDDLPDVRSQIAMHSYRNPDLIRVITLGMRKFGLPDLVIDQLPSGNSRSAANTINACAQLLLEGRTPIKGKLMIKLAAIRHAASRASAQENPGDGAHGNVLVKFDPIEREEGDPHNLLWRIEFPESQGITATERALDGFATLFGSTDKITQAKDRDAMHEASERARKAFFAQVPTFRKGFAPNERLMIKAGFTVPGGTEYMWVEVTGWKEQAVVGILANDSYYDKSLREGRQVTIKFSDVYDYIHYKPDGTEEGNETGKILEAQEKL